MLYLWDKEAQGDLYCAKAQFPPCFKKLRANDEDLFGLEQFLGVYKERLFYKRFDREDKVHRVMSLGLGQGLIKTEVERDLNHCALHGRFLLYFAPSCITLKVLCLDSSRVVRQQKMPRLAARLQGLFVVQGFLLAAIDMCSSGSESDQTLTLMLISLQDFRVRQNLILRVHSKLRDMFARPAFTLKRQQYFVGISSRDQTPKSRFLCLLFVKKEKIEIIEVPLKSLTNLRLALLSSNTPSSSGATFFVADTEAGFVFKLRIAF